MRAIAQSETREAGGSRPNPEIAVYDTSGPYTDPDAAIDPRLGLPPIRAAWIEERADTEPVERFDRGRVIRRARPARSVTQMHYARRGIVTPEMEFVAIREGLRREALADAGLHAQHAGESFGAAIPRESH